MIIQQFSSILLCSCLVFLATTEGNPRLKRAIDTKSLNKELREALSKVSNAKWNYFTQANSNNEGTFNKALEDLAATRRQQRETVLKEGDEKNREIESFLMIGEDILANDDKTKFENAKKAMKRIIDETKINGKNINEVRERMKSVDVEEKELKSLWEDWHKTTGPKTLSNFETMYSIGNMAAKKYDNRKFNNLLDLWLADWEMDGELMKKTEEIAKELKPLYQKLHAYVREKLAKKKKYLLPKDMTIPAHLFGDMWTENWNNLAKLVRPYEDVDLDTKMNEKLKKVILVFDAYKLSYNFIL